MLIGILSGIHLIKCRCLSCVQYLCGTVEPFWEYVSTQTAKLEYFTGRNTTFMLFSTAGSCTGQVGMTYQDPVSGSCS